MERRLVLVHDSQPRRRVRRTVPAWNILWLRTLESMQLSYDLQIDCDYEDTLSLGCDVTFSALGASGDLEGKEVDVYFKRVVGERTSGDVSVGIEEDHAWMDIYVDDYALHFLVMMYQKAQRLYNPLGFGMLGTIFWNTSDRTHREIREFGENGPDRVWRLKTHKRDYLSENGFRPPNRGRPILRKYFAGRHAA
jgi:hypothetical protein